jgi:hypothetical protein
LFIIHQELVIGVEDVMGMYIESAEECCILTYGGYTGDYIAIEQSNCTIGSNWIGYECISTNI